MRFLREHDIGGPFQSSALEDVNNFIHTWDDAEHEFQHKELEARRKALLKSAQNFREEIATHTFPSNVSGYLTMDLRDYEDRPEKLAIRKHLNDLATDLYNQHQEFVRFGRRTV